MSAQIHHRNEPRPADERREASGALSKRRPGWIARLLPAVLAAYELRYLIRHLMSSGTTLETAGSSPLGLCVVLLLAAGAGWLLRESGRGLAEYLPRRRWSLRFVGEWTLCSVLLVALLAAAGRVHAVPAIAHGTPLSHSFAGALWSTVPTVVLVGLVLAASLYGVSWLLLEFVRVRHRPGVGRVARLTLGTVRSGVRSAPSPLRAGWSDRGPPSAAVLLAS